MAATPRNTGVRKAYLTCRTQGNELDTGFGPRLALSTEKNKQIQELFEKNLAPWKFSGSPSDYFHIKGKLFHVETLKEESSSWVASGSAIEINNLPSRFMPTNLVNLLSTPPYGSYPANFIKTDEPKGRIPIQPLKAFKSPTWVSYDMSEYVSLRNGDIWHGQVDWQKNAVKQEKNVTNLGILNNLKPIAWYEKDFYLYYKRGINKPILRINLDSGQIDELEQTAAMHQHSHGSPDGRFIFYSDGKSRHLASGDESLVHVYDCKTRQAFTMDASVDERNYIGTSKQRPRPYRVEPRAWLSNSLFMTEIGWYDLEKRKRMLFIEAQGIIRNLPEQLFKTVTYRALPVSRFAEVTVQSFIKNQKEIYRRYRIDRLTNTTVELPMEFTKRNNTTGNITWVDENRYVFPEEQEDSLLWVPGCMI